MPSQSTKREKYFHYIVYSGKMPTQAGYEHLSSSFLLIDRVFAIFQQQKYGPKVLEMDMPIFAPTQ